ncbi:MAG: Peptidoglycan glycosyltransferase [Candidatus Moranbacteria bacterium GW2011_GWD2_36_12]|nr:MAG: Peptidoglycan glycosyltransferase [Candidatus Moranbacteria bacterium GW2011_GWD2_36_12]KKQ06484.1 MAG: Peptidoglycan glycosyltransferase [Candidatus Moranbacteria bacterium GW2011_GWE2_36_40]
MNIGIMTKRRYIVSKNTSGMEIEDYVLSATEKEAARMEKPLEKKWFDFLWWFLLLFVFLLGLRVIFLTVVKGAYYKDVSDGNSIRSIVIKAPRGRIFDRSGKSLVNNVPSMDAVIIPVDVPRDSVKTKEIAGKVAFILNMNEADVWTKLESNNTSKSLNPVLLKENIQQDQALTILEKANTLAGISIEKTAIRDYVDGPIFSHILGYDGKIEQKELAQNQGYLLTDYIGKQGIEKSYEKYLRGVHGADQVEVDSMGNTKREVGIINPKPGSDLIMSIDGDLQKKLYDSITGILQKTGTSTASAVAIDPRNGQVLAMVNLPSYDNNLFANKISGNDYASLINNPDKPLFNRAIAGEYPPGSTIKPAIALAALSEGVIDQSTIIDGLGGTLRIGSYSFGDWKTHGPSDVRIAIAESNDIFFYTIGGGYGNIQGLGMNRMKKWYNLFGFGLASGIDIGGESEGLIPDEKWKMDNIKEKWSVGNSYHAAIGQGFVSATPLQIANFTAAIANGGTLYKPHLVSQIKKGTGEIIDIDPEILSANFAAPELLSVVREGMRKTILSGTAQPLKDLPIEVAGKTGTAQFGTEDKTHAWFISFAPYENPEIAMAVLVEGGGEGHSSSVPVTKEVYQWYFGDRN